MAIIAPTFGNGPPPPPEELRKRQAIANKLLEGSQGFEPLQHPLQMVAKWTQAGVGAYAQHRINEQMKAGQQHRAQSLANIIPGKGGLF